MYFFEQDGFKISYTQKENNLGENVLFIHGNLASKEWWYPTMECLSGESEPKGTFVAADWRGYGDSKGLKEKSEINFDTFAEDFISLLQDKQMQNVHLVGHSTGGFIAFKMALKNESLFKSITFLDSVGPKGLELHLPKEQVLAHFDQLAANEEYRRPVIAATIKDMDPNDPQFEKLYKITSQCDPVMWRGVIEVLSDDSIDYTEDLKKLNLPCLILHGDQDLVLPMTTAESLNGALKNSQLQVLAGQGHSMNMENPEGLAKILKDFWQKQ